MANVTSSQELVIDSVVDSIGLRALEEVCQKLGLNYTTGPFEPSDRRPPGLSHSARGTTHLILSGLPEAEFFSQIKEMTYEIQEEDSRQRQAELLKICDPNHYCCWKKSPRQPRFIDLSDTAFPDHAYPVLAQRRHEAERSSTVSSLPCRPQHLCCNPPNDSD